VEGQTGEERRDESGPAPTPVGHLVDPRPVDRDERELRGNEEGVARDQERDGQQAKGGFYRGRRLSLTVIG
jgi:hypothetical protein